MRRCDHISATLTGLGWPTVEDMVGEADVVLINKLLTREDAPEALKALLVYRSQVTSRTSRTSGAPLIQLPRVRTELAKRSFNYRALKRWNAQGADVRSRYATDTE